jgi:hypothetical protein
MVLLMFLPVVLALVLYGYLARSHRSSGYRWRAVWLLPVAVLIHLAAGVAHHRGFDPDLVNRVEALSVLVILAIGLWSNIEAVSEVWSRFALLGVVGGAALNALATLIYGSMPVLTWATVVAGYAKPAGAHPDPRYVYSDGLGWLAVVIGDVVPIPHGLKVLSIGDLVMIPALAIALALYLLTLRVASSPQHFHQPS